VDGEVYVDGCPLTAEALQALGPLEWRGPKGNSRKVVLRRVRVADTRLLVLLEGVFTREIAATFTNGTLWTGTAALPDPGPGVSYAYELIGYRVVGVDGRDHGTVTDVVFNRDLPLLQMGDSKRMLPCHAPFMKQVDAAARVITLDLPPGFEEL
jgi:ribosomal 30S subunit maturation factor RimM